MAAGASNQGSIDLLDARTLKSKKVLATAVASLSRSLSVVAWSADGKQVFAVGSWINDKGQFAICVWSADGMGASSCIPVAGNTITALPSTADGRLFYATADPSLGVLGADGRPLISVGNNLQDFRNLRSRFRLASDASALAFRESRPGHAIDAFDTRQPSWTETGKDWQPARTTAGKTSIDNWFERLRPMLN